ncbi:MAG: hypothetical protein ACRDVO_01870 [Jiangellaceae bacterium]
MEAAELKALVEEAMKRSAVVWLSYPGGGWPRAVWHVWHDGMAYVVSGGPEQLLPGIEQAERVVVIARAKDSRARLVTWVAAAAVQTPGTEGWQVAVEALRAKRLNAVQGEALTDVWAERSTVTRLTPTGEVTEYPGAYPTDSQATAPVESPATTVGRLPWVAHRRARRGPAL